MPRVTDASIDQPPTPKASKRPLIIGLVALVVVLIAATAAFVAFQGGGDTFTVTGELDLRDDDTIEARCVGQGGFSDIVGGAQVVLTDQDGKTVAVGRLSDGFSDRGVCRYFFELRDAPGDRDFYGLEIGHRSKIQYSRKDLDRKLMLSLD